MGSPMSMGGGHMVSWNGNDQGQATLPDNNFQESGIQLRSMGLKVHYTFDKDSKINCLARYPQTIQVQTVPIDETNTIGVLDLRICIQAVIECSPELASGDGDYTIYALDYSEPDTPLVGQGMLSWALETLGGDMGIREPKMVTGRVTKNLLGVFGGGNRETLEVKLKLASAVKVQRLDSSRGMDTQQSAGTPSAMTPTGASEWNSFINNNPHIGQPSQYQRGASPALSHASYGPPALLHRDSFTQASQQSLPAQDVQRVAPVAVDPQSAPAASGPSSRPSSRTSNRAPRRKPPTGRPRGRPRKRPIEGNTSGYEDGTEGEDGSGPAKKRVTTTKVDSKTNSNPFGAGPDSLRVAASTSGSIRTMRPVGSGQELPGAGSHLQDIPRAPTPVPDGSFLGKPGRGPNMRRSSLMSQELAPKYPSQYGEPKTAPFPGHEDSRSPESGAPTPTFSEDSPADIRSSPPVARTTPFIRSSPPSSPILPPMPEAQLPQDLPHDLSFTGTDVDNFFTDELFQAAMRETMPGFAAPNNPIETTDATGVPMQVFRMQDGPDGQDMVHIRNYNTPLPTSTPAGPDSQSMMHMRNYNTPHPTSTPADPLESSSLPPLPPPPAPKQAAARPKPKRASTAKDRTTTSPPALAPTPPPTTDAMEKPNSPMAPPQLPQDLSGTTDSNTNADLEPTQPQLSLPELPASQSNATKPRPKKNTRPLSRSLSAGPGVLATVPASEPAGPSSLSHVTSAVPASEGAALPPSLKRSASTGPLVRPTSSGGLVLPGPLLLPKPAEGSSQVPASDSAGASALSPPGLMLPEPVCPPSDALPPPSSPTGAKASKNVVKRNAIKQRLEAAIMRGEMPPFCNNCGAIETPTWRKIWTREQDNIPGPVEYSDKPGKITAIEVLTRDEENKPTSYRVIKKSLGPDDEASVWQERLLCNPCGIWLAKCKGQRPEDRWERDASRLGQGRSRKRSSTSSGNSRSKKRKGDSQFNPTSEAYLPTDALGPIEPSSPKLAEYVSQQFGEAIQEDRESEIRETSAGLDQNIVASRPESKSSREGEGDGTSKSPIDLELDEEDLGGTKRLLFPSPRKEGVPMALGELSVNIVQTTTECRQQKDVTFEKENVEFATETQATEQHDDDMADLFGSPTVARPCTPPPKPRSAAPASAFKTPTRPTPSHRPITRSVSRSMRSSRSLKSPIRFGLDSPSQNIRSQSGSARSSRPRRSPRHHESEEFTNDDSLMGENVGRYHQGSVSPITREIIGLIEEQNNPTPRSYAKPPEDVLPEEIMRTNGWFNMFKSPEKNAVLQKSFDLERAGPPREPEPWYAGSMDNWESWMRQNGGDMSPWGTK